VNYDAIWPYFVCMALVFAASAIPFIKIDAPASVKIYAPPSVAGQLRAINIDGLRGFLAFSVFFHHGAYYHRLLRDGQWLLRPSFYALIGQAGVSVFFMITGYLFWQRMIRANGRPDWLRLYTGRVFRIGPLYLFAVLVMFFIVLRRTGYDLHVPLGQFLQQVALWLPLGFGGEGPDINGYPDTARVLSGVTWSLDFEWKFYLSLLVISLAARRKHAHLPFAAAGFAVCVACLVAVPNTMHMPTVIVGAALFFSGMLSASLQERGLAVRLPDFAASALALALLALLAFTSYSAYAIWPIVLLALFFFLIVSGASLFGLLSSRAARRMGEVSYGVYLLQGLVLTSFFSFQQTRAFALASPARHWAMISVCALLLLILAALTHIAIERSGIALGKRVYAALRPESRARTGGGPLSPTRERPG
jgi:peptidoglycan/LPS O-acetylase OafA/YrhL